MKKLLTYLYFSFLSISFITAQQGVLTGLIQDAETDEPLIAATVRSGEIGATSNIDGRYELQLPVGEQAVEISYVGYETQRLLVAITAGETTELDIKMGGTATLLQTATVSSSKFEKPLEEVTVSLEVLKSDLIDNTNTTNITQPLQKISGVTIIDGQANIRGGSGWSYGAGSRVLLLIDDIPALQADAGFPNWVDVPVESIAQVEIVKGAASALYGSSAMNGIINIKTAYATSEPYTRISTFYKHYDSPKDESLKWWGKELTLYERDEDNTVIDSSKFTPSVFGGQKGYNRPGQLGLSVAHRQKLGKTDLILGGYGLLDESYRQANYSNYARFNAGIKHRISDRLSVGFNSNFNRGKGRSTFYWQRLPEEIDNPGSYLPDVTAFSNSNRFRYTIDPYLNYFDNSGNQHKVLTRFYGINNKNDNNQGNTSQLYYTEYQFLKNWEKYDLNLTTGIVGTWTNIDAELYNGIYKAANYAAFLQVDKKIMDVLNLSFGARYEQNKLKNPDYINADTIVFRAGTDKDSKPVFRAGLSQKITDYTFVRASWGQGYRFPVLAEKYINTDAGGITVIPNPNLNPETGWSAEVGIKQGFKVGGFNGYVDAALFRSDYKNMMEFTVTQSDTIFNNLIAFQSQNIGNTSIKGLDLSVAGQGKTGDWTVGLLAGYTYIKPQYTNFDSIQNIQPPVTTSDKNVLKYRSRHSVKFDIEAKYKIFSLGFSTIYNSKIEAMDPVLGAINRIREYLDENQQNGSTKMDIRFAVQPTKKIKVSLLGENILNREYVSRPGLLDAPRSYTVRLDYTL